MAIFTTQDYRVTISDTGQDLSTASTLKIRGKKPDGVTFEQVAIVGGSDSQNASIDITGATNNIRGKWEFQIEAIISSKTYYSAPVGVTVEDVITDPTP